ncbi:hypothetical protein [uncultured Bifidobacterium sp.]|uniref:hypothetical protein n=1 Tax=uncultured Bifidobacterium sp. TaxID=165187 RepID=UPI0028DB5EE5|nr:hypothetical protein [uncultured Bifidobacterium sp.]
MVGLLVCARVMWPVVRHVIDIGTIPYAGRIDLALMLTLGASMAEAVTTFMILGVRRRRTPGMQD